MEKNYKKLENRKHMMSSLVCKICMTPKLTPDDYKKHMKERSHNEMVKQFEQGLQEDSSE
jgi:hydrogenase maturation factor HypF (carbamoyltransferase family)